MSLLLDALKDREPESTDTLESDDNSAIAFDATRETEENAHSTANLTSTGDEDGLAEFASDSAEFAKNSLFELVRDELPTTDEPTQRSDSASTHEFPNIDELDIPINQEIGDSPCSDEPSIEDGRITSVQSDSVHPEQRTIEKAISVTATTGAPKIEAALESQAKIDDQEYIRTDPEIVGDNLRDQLKNTGDQPQPRLSERLGTKTHSHAKTTDWKLPVLGVALLMIGLGLGYLKFFANANDYSSETEASELERDDLPADPIDELSQEPIAIHGAQELTAKDAESDQAEPQETTDRQDFSETPDKIALKAGTSTRNEEKGSAAGDSKSALSEGESSGIPFEGPIQESQIPEIGSIEGIKIKEKRLHRSTGKWLDEAYKNFQQKNYEKAREFYSGVLSKEPKNIGAMLGIAAIYSDAGSTERAEGILRTVLELDPGNPYARSVLARLGQDQSRTESESRLKTLIGDYPKSADLRFTLANLYARRSRWPQAQKAYFDAFSLDNTRPDYAFNLAVSLDRLGKTRIAKRYYKKALQLAKTGPTHFEATRVQERILQIERGSDRN